MSKGNRVRKAPNAKRPPKGHGDSIQTSFDAAIYIGAMSDVLQKIASEHDLNVISYLLRMTEEEANNIASRRHDA